MRCIAIFRKKKEQPPLVIDYIVVGLGNPGAKYEMTRHNAGWLAADLLSEKLGGGRLSKTKCKATYTTCQFDSKNILIMKPQTFMNLSGDAVRDMADAFHVPPSNIIVMFDDVNLACGKLRLRRGGSHGGHNGIKDIIYKMNSDAIPRIKIGVGEPNRQAGEDMADYVLSVMDSDTLTAIKTVPDAVCAIISDGIELAMQKFN